MNSNLPAIQNPTIALPALTDPDLVREVMEENLEGIVPEFPRIKFPSGGGLAFEVPGDGEEAEVVKELVGVIVDKHSVNAYWSKKYDGEKNPPDCSSMDGKVGLAPEGANVPWAGGHQDCATCPFNQWGTAVDQQGNATNGKACKNMRRVALLREEEIIPLIVTVPPTSNRAFDTYIIGLTAKAKRMYGVVSKIKLKKAQSGGGIDYSEGIFSKVKDLSPEEVQHMKVYAEGIKPVLRKVTIDATDYNVEERSSGGAVDISDQADELA